MLTVLLIVAGMFVLLGAYTYGQNRAATWCAANPTQARSASTCAYAGTP